MADDFPAFSEPWKNSDATLIVEKRKFHVHQTLLTLSSPFFEALFSDTKFAEGKTKTATLQDKKSADVCLLLQVLYPPHKNLTVEMTDRILPLADEFLMWGIKKQCERALVSVGQFNFKSVATADRYKLRHLRESAVNYITIHYPFRTLLNSNAFTRLDESTRLLILEGRIRYIYQQLPARIETLVWGNKEKTLRERCQCLKEALIKTCDLSPGQAADAL